MAANPALDGKFFAYNGELVHGQGVLVELPHNLFNLTTQVAHLAANPAMDMIIGPFGIGDPDTTTSLSRSVVMVPHKYGGLFLSLPDSVPPITTSKPSYQKAVWERLHILPSTTAGLSSSPLPSQK